MGKGSWSRVKDRAAYARNYERIFGMDSKRKKQRKTSLSATKNGKPPNPGSPEAVAQGCTCPVLDNCNGKGSEFGGPGTFWMHSGCPLHGNHQVDRLLEAVHGKTPGLPVKQSTRKPNTTRGFQRRRKD